MTCTHTALVSIASVLDCSQKVGAIHTARSPTRQALHIIVGHTATAAADTEPGHVRGDLQEKK